LVGKVVRVSANSAIVQRIDDATFGVGAQLVQADHNGPKGTAEGQRDSSLLRFSVIDQSGTSVALKKGDVAVTLGLLGESFPAGLVVGSVVRTVDAGGAIARDAELRPVVDLDSLTIVKVLRYPPVPVP
jgi:cell shape-determining protein MreC